MSQKGKKMSKLQSTPSEVNSTSPSVSYDYNEVDDAELLKDLICEIDTRYTGEFSDSMLSVITQELTNQYAFLRNYDMDSRLSLVKSINKKLNASG